MATYKDVCEAFASSRTKYADYHTAAIQFGAGLMKALRQYLACPENVLTLTPLDREREEGKQYFIAGATHLDDDSYWHLGVLLRVYEAPNVYPQEPVLLMFKFKKYPGYYEVRLADIPEEFRVTDANVAQQFKPLFDLLTRTLIDRYEHGLERFLFGGGTADAGVSVMGFKMPSPDEREGGGER